ncbi:MAG: universal stress protein [Pseudonocardia sp.]|uniref:universal stress protein n=1 Tax=unclassified Pseudonocardia TaxID=2619320 RepID=UPI00086D16FD|nr:MULTISPECIES: universal stress protein [unclassified Pseudonocardia]MBN9110785.1 universal stress protein [Pseudonocardia sp.]ODU27153.1 MAG: hypothetical protein ABS80_04780 [Pseudonocardia sp. SCN 72-51]ODV04476.1 MAG: hypothetical protein ABT15_21170 [Pseudonocardia sp. SCN 73-27]
MNDQKPRCVVVGVDGSDAATAAVRWAAEEACRRHIPVRLVTAVETVTPIRIGATALEPPFVRDMIVAAAEERLAEARAIATDAAGDVEIVTEVRGGPPVAVLRQESADASVLVVGNRGVGGFAGLLAGSVSVGLAASAACPVVVARGTVTAGGPVVVGIDGSSADDAVAAFAFDAAGARNARLVVAHAWSDATIDEAGWTLLQWDEIEAEQLGILDAQLAGWSEKYPDVEVTRIVEHENAARMLIGRSATAQLVVVGSRGRGAVRGALLGSVGQAVLRHADCPVAVVRP